MTALPVPQIEARTMRYGGYLSPYVGRIVALHGDGCSTRRIAEELFALGARATTTDFQPRRMTRDRHVRSLRAMTLHILQRLGLRVRRKRSPRRL